MDISSFLNQHKDAAEVVGQIESKISSAGVDDAAGVRSLLSTLVGKLSIHLAMEDKNIYPKAAQSDNEELKNMAERLQNEMAGLAGALTAYSNKWASASMIEGAAPEFATETKGVVDALKKRIQVEESEFYPLVEKYL